MKFDFSGYATKNNLKCSDGRIIRKDAFKHNDGQMVPLVWQHMHDSPENVVGHALLENREDGVYAYGKFNDTESGRHCKALVEHGDISSLSIHANQLVQNGSDVLHGVIRELSLVLAGANPGALIDNVSIAHGDGNYIVDSTEAIIYTGEELDLEDLEHEDTSKSEKTVGEIFDTLTEEQKNVVYAMLSQVVGDDEEEEEDEENNTKKMDQSSEGGITLKHNVFEKKDNKKVEATLTHSQLQEILEGAQKCGSLKESFLQHAGTYGIDDIDVLFPDAKTVTPNPALISRDMGWVNGVISGTNHSPFSRVKSTAADITAEAARAKGYVTGSLKKDEVIRLLKRVVTPTTVYKKQKLDRDDIIDITDLDVVAWLKSEMRLMLNEELARAILVGDGRDPEDPDKINDENIIPIYSDDDMYAHHVTIEADKTYDEMIDDIIRARKAYKGSGTPKFYTTPEILTEMLLVKDGNGQRLYRTAAELAAALRVSEIVEVPVMENITRVSGTDTLKLVGEIVNLKDYTVGADKGGQVSMFDDFDIDYNQYKYLIETRCSGALTLPKSALVIEQKVQG